MLWEGRPSGRPSLGRRVFLGYSIVALILLVGGPWLFLRRGGEGVLRPSLQVFARSGEVVTFAPKLVWRGRWWGPPLLVGGTALVLLALEAWRGRAWRQRRYCVTDRRVYAMDSRGRVLAQLLRPDIGAVDDDGSTVIVKGATAIVRFEGVADVAALRGALALT